MFDEVFENLDRYDYRLLDERMVSFLRQAWNKISVDYVTSYLKRHRCFEVISNGDICRVELKADEVRSAVYSNIHLMETTSCDIMNEWFDLSIEEQDTLLTKAFPGTEMYGV